MKVRAVRKLLDQAQPLCVSASLFAILVVRVQQEVCLTPQRVSMWEVCFFLRTCEGRKLDGLGNGLLCPGLGSLIAKEFGNLL